MSRNKVRHIFTYGTLMSFIDGAMGASERARLKEEAICIGPASIRGRVFDAGPCPGAVRNGRQGDRVHGELWQLPEDDADLLVVLDHYEGCAAGCPLPYPYQRRKIRVRAPDGRRVTAWMFEWAGETADLRQVADGRWRPTVRPREAVAGAKIATGNTAV